MKRYVSRGIVAVRKDRVIVVHSLRELIIRGKNVVIFVSCARWLLHIEAASGP